MSFADDPLRHAAAPPPPQPERIIVMPPQRGVFSSLMGCLFFLVVVLPGILVAILLLAAVVSIRGTTEIEEQHHSLSRTARAKVAIITVDGAILDEDGFVKKQIDHVREDDDVCAVVLRVNSPGGTVTASDYLFHHLRELVAERDIPMVVSMGGMAASGGYYVAMAVGGGERVIFAEPTTWCGSIGVIIPHYNVTGLMKRWEIEEDSIASGPLKQMGSITRPMTPEEREIFQHLVDDSFRRFQEVVKYGRPKLAADADLLAKVSTGRIFTTREALDNQLVDVEGFIEAAIERAVQLAGRNESNVQVVKYKRPPAFFGMPFTAEAKSWPDLEKLVDLTSPRAYYLCTWLPPLVPEAR